MYCANYEETSCGKKICCRECGESDCEERCNDSEECDCMTEKEPFPVDERYEEVTVE